MIVDLFARMRGRDPNGVSDPTQRVAATHLWRLRFGSIGGVWLLFLTPLPAIAHALPTRHQLPTQLQNYVVAAGAVVALTFLLLAFGTRSRAGALGYPRIDLRRSSVLRAGAAAIRWALRVFGLASFLIIIAAGLFGNQHAFKNIAPVLVWVVWWVGLAFVCSLLANVWPYLNPWRTVFDIADRLAGGRIAQISKRVYPVRLGSWPAVCVLLIFAWMELVWAGAERPRAVAIAILFYSAFTWGGMTLYGRNTGRYGFDPYLLPEA